MGRLEVLRNMLSSGVAGTQDELREQLHREGFEVTQSTISRDLRRLGAIKVLDEAGRTVYRFSMETSPPPARASLDDLIISIQHNGSTIVLHSRPGSASLIASHLDHYKPGGILGTIAGDDTIFIAPRSAREIVQTIAEIRASFRAEA